MGSYVLLLMLSGFMRTFPNEGSVGWRFMDALRYYGKEFDARYLAVYRGESIIFKEIPSLELIVYDAFLPEINAASSVTLYEDIRALFSKSFDAFNSKNSTSLLNNILTPI